MLALLKTPRIVGIIPARMAASRFPGKPLASLCGRPMIEHVYRRASRATCFARVYIATPDTEVYEVASRFGAPAIMTSPTHTRATDRVAEAARGLSADVVVNIQGDEPMIDPAALDLLGDVMSADATLACANLVNRITKDEDFLNPNQIKVVCDGQSNVLYMSRQPIPSGTPGPAGRLRQLGIIAFRRDFIETFASLEQTPLERAESVDMLRALEHGFTVRAVVSPYHSFGVDTVDDLALAEAALSGDPLVTELFSKQGSR